MRTTLLLVPIVLGFTASAQLRVNVLNSTTQEPLAYAQFSWGRIGGPTDRSALCGPDGRAVLDIGTDEVRMGVVLRTALLGYSQRVDTVRSLSPITLHLMPGSIQLDQVVVTGQYRPTAADQSVHRLRVIDAQRIREMAAENLGDVLRQELNIRLSQDNILGTSMAMQGLGGENVKVLVDGVPMIGRQNGNLDLSRIDLSGIDRVEVVQGPLSVNYGTNALAGTINLITRKRGPGSSSLNVTTYAEHLGRGNLAVTAGRRIGKGDVLLTVGHNFFGGWDPRQGDGFYDPRPRLADSTRFQQWKPREQTFGRLGYRWAVNDAWSLGYKGEVMLDRIVNRGIPRAPSGGTAFDEQYLTSQLDNALFVDRAWRGGGTLNAILAHNRYRRIRNTWLNDLTTLEEQLVPTSGMQDTSRFTLTNGRVVFAHAPDSASVHYEVGTDLNLETGAGDRIGDGRGERMGDYAVFASMEWRPWDRLVVRPGARYAYNTRYGAPFVPSLNLRWRLSGTITLRASYARGFRAPSLKELYLFFVDVNHDIVGNTDLLAERSDNFGISAAYRKPTDAGLLTAELNLFHNTINDRITLAQINATRYSYVNIGTYRTMGGSASAGWSDPDWALNVGVAATGWNDGLGASVGAASWLFAPELNTTLTRTWGDGGWSASVLAKYQGTAGSYIYVSQTEVSRASIAAYTMADVNISRRLWKERLRATLGCKNLGDVTNVGSSVGAGGVHGGGGNIPMAIGRTYFLRLELNLKGAER